jgi:hypothetical protein
MIVAISYTVFCLEVSADRKISKWLADQRAKSTCSEVQHFPLSRTVCSSMISGRCKPAKLDQPRI